MSNICDICGKVYAHKSSLTRHVKLTHKRISAYRCCGRPFREMADMTNHRCNHHGTQKTHVCDICQKSFGTTKALKLHKGQVHDNKKENCFLCGKSFARKADLKTHMDSHAENKNHHCHCGKSYRHRSNLARHRRGCKK